MRVDHDPLSSSQGVGALDVCSRHAGAPLALTRPNADPCAADCAGILSARAL